MTDCEADRINAEMLKNECYAWLLVMSPQM